MVFADTLVRIIFHNWNKKLIQLPRFLGYLKQEKITLIATSPFLFVLEDVSLYSQLFPKGESTNIFFRLTLKFAGWYNLTIKWLHSGHCLDFPSRQREELLSQAAPSVDRALPGNCLLWETLLQLMPTCRANLQDIWRPGPFYSVNQYPTYLLRYRILIYMTMRGSKLPMGLIDASIRMKFNFSLYWILVSYAH